MTPIVSPNPNIPYYGGECEGYVEGTANQATLPKPPDYITYGAFPTAIAKWSANLGNHTDLPPTGVRVPVYFSLGNNRDGHTALQLEDGRLASSTMPGYHTTPYIHPNLQDLINVYAKANNGCTYLGWSEYIGKLQVVKEQEMLTDDSLYIAIRGVLRREPTDAEAHNFTKDPNEALKSLWANGGKDLYYNHTPPPPANAVQLKPGVYEVK